MNSAPYRTLHAPWTDVQVKNLEAYQLNDYVHPYTCGTDQCGRNLVPTPKGWMCLQCSYRQTWCHEAHADYEEWAEFNPFTQEHD